MNLVLDPVWPWSGPWEALLQVPVLVRLSAVGAGLLALVLPMLLFARAGRRLLWATSSVLLVAVVLVLRHTWPLALGATRTTAGSGLEAHRNAFGDQTLLVLLLLGPPALIGAGIGTYLGTPGLSRRRLGFIACLRLLAFLLALLALIRPALGWMDSEEARSQLFILLDRSRSMTVQDERGKQSRWDLAVRSLRGAEPALNRLRQDQQVDVQLFSFADELREVTLDELGQPDGKRTETGQGLRSLFDRRDARLPLRGVLLVSDGADNGTIPALAEAMRWRGSGGQLHTFASGNPGTTPMQNDIAITSISTSPMPFVPVKGKLTVKLSIDARGYENSQARVRLFMEGDDGKDREVLAREVRLALTTGNEVTLVLDAPAKPGEVKLKAVVQTDDPDDLPLNNQIETFVTVSKEGMSVLLVDRQRAHEPQFLCDALADDPRIRITPLWVRGGAPLAVKGRVSIFDEQPFDVIILGDVTAAQLRSIDPQAPEKIEKQVARGAGLLVLGGYVNLGNGEWKGTALEKLLPVDLSVKDQVESPVRMTPTEDGLRRARYLFRLDDGADANAAWEKLAKLDGMTKLRLPEPRRGLEVVLATDEKKEHPLLVMQTYGARGDVAAARVLVFGGDTTYRWVRSEEGQRMHGRFWRQLIVWLARQEDAEGSVWVKPDVRRLPVRGELGFNVGMRGKGGGPDLRDGKYDVEVFAPDGTKSRVPLVRGASATRGVFAATKAPGIYRVVVRGQGKDPSGGTVAGEATGRVIVYDEDLELSKPAADPEFLKKVAATSGGEALRVEQLAEFLNRLAEQPLERGKPKMELRPDWRTTNRSPFLVVFFLVFSVIVTLEWGLRRRWGMV